MKTILLSRRDLLRHLFVASAAIATARAVYAQTAVTLDFVPFFSQQDYRASNFYDCGESCWMMMLLWRANVLNVDRPTMPTVDDLSAMWGKPVGEVAWADAHMLPSVGRMGFTADYSDSAVNDWYRQQLSAGYPCIALVDYSGFYPENQAQAGVSGHFVVVVGFDDGGFVIHDPLWLDAADGAYRHISSDEWWVSSQGVGFAVTGFA